MLLLMATSTGIERLASGGLALFGCSVVPLNGYACKL